MIVAFGAQKTAWELYSGFGGREFGLAIAESIRH